MLLFAALLCGTNVWGEELTVADDTYENNAVPIDGYNCDGYVRSQIIYPATDLSSMNGKSITGLTFYMKSTGTKNWGVTFEISLLEVSEAAFTSATWHSIEGATLVYTGVINTSGVNELNIEFDEGYAYSGGNLLIDITATNKGSWWKPTFYGYNDFSTYYALTGYNSSKSSISPSRSLQYPKTTFTYESAVAVSCAKPTSIEVEDSNVEANSAIVSLAGLNNATLEYKKKSESDWTIAVTGLGGTSYTLTGLSAFTAYDVQVKNVCGEEESKYITASFSTKCGANNIPWTEDFENGYTIGFSTSDPGCWHIIDANTSSYSYPRIYVTSKSSNSDFVQNGNNAFFIISSGSADSYIIFPEMNAPLNTLQITLSHKGEANYSGAVQSSKLTLGYVTDANDASTFVALRGEFERSSNWTTEEESLAGVPAEVASTAHLAIKVGQSENNNYYTGIDDISITVASSCAKPTGLAVGTTLPDGATLTWDEGGASAWQYIVVAKNTAEDWKSPVDVNTNAATVSGLAADTEYDFYLRTNCGGSQSNSTKVSFTPVCPAPTGVTVSAIGTTSATVSWTAAANITEYQYCVVEAGETATWDKSTTSTSVALELEPSTSYDFYVRSYKNASSYKAAAKVNFRTACVPYASAAAWSESFDTYATGSSTSTAPGCWGLLNANEGGRVPHVYVKNNSEYYYSSWAKDGSQFLFFSTYSDSGYGYALLPEFETALSTLQIKFSHIEEDGSLLQFGYLTNVNDASTFVALATYTSTSLKDEVVSLATVLTGARLAFRHIGAGTYGRSDAAVDAISFEVLPSCFKPTLNEASAITPDGATFSWTASDKGETQYQYICVPAGETPDWSAATLTSELTATVSDKAAGTYDFYVRSYCGTDDQSDAVSKSFTTATVPAPASVTVSAITNNSATASWTAPDVTYSVQYQWKASQTGSAWSTPSADLSAALSGLEANTEYTIYVRTYYSAGVQSAEASTTFTTACNPVTISTDAYVEHFETFPSCWDNSEGTTLNANYKWSSVSGGQSGKCMRFEGVENGWDITNILASPLFFLEADADLTFYWKNAKTGDYKVQIAVDHGARQDLVTGLVNNNDWQEKEIALTAYKDHIIQLFFCGTSANDGNANLWLDELAITPQACRKPATLNEATAITAEGATLTWTAGGSAADYQYAVAEAGQTPVWEAENVVSEQAVTLSGLQASTSYDFYVRTYCDEDNQSEARKVSFRTGCGVVAALPWEEDFDNVALAGDIPECWDKSLSTLSSYSYEWKLGGNYSGRNGGKAMQCGLAVEEAGKQNILATPSIQLGSKNMLTFWCKKSAGDNFTVEISADGGSSKTQLIDLTSEALSDWTLQYADLSAYDNQKVILYFKATSAGGYAGDMIYIDNIRVARAEVFNDSEDNEDRFATLAAAGETMDVIFNRTLLCNGDYNTLCLPFSLSAEQIAKSPLAEFKLKAFDYATVTEDELQIAICGASSIEAGVPYFAAYQGAPMANQTQQIFQDVVITATAPGSVSSSDVEYRGIFNPVYLTNSSDYLYLAAGNTIYWPGADNKQVKGFRAYFKVVTGNNAPIRRGMPVRLVERAEVTTGVENVHGEDQALKVLENGQVVIIRNGMKYNLQGQKIQ